MLIRIFDVILSSLGIILLLPVFLIVSIIILLESPGGVFYIQERIGKGAIPFSLIKFRSMRTGSDTKGLLTVGMADNRITKVGLFIRKYKLDELPQLFNVFIGDMSLVGPRPEVKKYVDLYSSEQRKVLSMRPGMTDLASIVYSNENELLEKQANPEQYYIDEIMPRKIELNMEFINSPSLLKYFSLIFKTIIKIF